MATNNDIFDCIEVKVYRDDESFTGHSVKHRKKDGRWGSGIPASYFLICCWRMYVRAERGRRELEKRLAKTENE